MGPYQLEPALRRHARHVTRKSRPTLSVVRNAASSRGRRTWSCLPGRRRRPGGWASLLKSEACGSSR
jgi:hypothetical protein